MDQSTIAAITQLVIGLATLATSIAAVIKAVEAKSKAEVVASQTQENHAETVTKLDQVVEQTNGVLTALPVAIAANQSQIAAVASDVETLKSVADHGHNP